MKTVSVKLSQVKVNAANPRTITDSKFQKLIDSLLAFPKMLELRPIVVDDTMTALGGNMRLRALVSIAEMDEAALTGRIMDLKDVKKKPQAERDALLQYWLAWQDKQEAGVVKASELSEDEQKQFIIKDNASFGQWDYDMLANEWDSGELEDWGVDTWQLGGAGEAAGERSKKVTELLSELKFDTPYYEPKNIVGLTLRGCVNREKFDKKIAFIEASGLTDEQKATMRWFAYRFLRIDFEGVANYYAFQASEEERAVMERLRLVLVDDGSVAGFMEDELIRTYNEMIPTDEETRILTSMEGGK